MNPLRYAWERLRAVPRSRRYLVHLVLELLTALGALRHYYLTDRPAFSIVWLLTCYLWLKIAESSVHDYRAAKDYEEESGSS